jgi:hypothetical protein
VGVAVGDHVQVEQVSPVDRDVGQRASPKDSTKQLLSDSERADNRRRLVEPMARDLVAVYLDVSLGDVEIRRG